MTERKSFLASTGVMGPLVGLIVFAVNNFLLKGDVISSADISTIIDQASLVIGSLIGIWGRVMATKQIGGRA